MSNTVTSVQRIETPLHEVDAAVVVVGLYSDGFPQSATAVDEASGGLISRLNETGETPGKLLTRTPLWNVAGVHAPQVLIVGLGPREDANRQVAFQAASVASKSLAVKQRERIAFFLPDDWSSDLHEAAIAGALSASQGQDLYRRNKKLFPPKELFWAGADVETVRAGSIIGEAVNLTRRLVNEPPQEITPETFAERCVSVASQHGLSIDVWDEKRLESERAGSLLAVAKGSDRPPRLVVLRYQGADKEQKPLALVGKGVTFDSGGLSLKTSEGMKTMKCDMAGAATVLGAIQAIAALKLPVNVVGLMGLVENMPGSRAMKLGDVLWSRAGKTIEVLNTDAEGRLVLADVLNVAVEMEPAHIIDLATLTGACVVALGTDVAGLMSNNDPWCDRIEEASRVCGEPSWKLPMFEEYGEQIQSAVADIRNIGKGRWAGAITAAKFLEEFVDDVPWTHIDIAGPSFLDSSKSWCDAGATGCFVRTLVEIARTYNN